MKSFLKQTNFEFQTDIAEYWGFLPINSYEPDEDDSYEFTYDYDDDYKNI